MSFEEPNKTEKNKKEKYLKIEPPKTYYFISEDGDMWSEEDLDGTLELKRKNIGNYFESEEEVRKVYKQLIAWKRLKDKGFRFACWYKRSDWAGLPKVKELENLIDITAYLSKDKIKEMEADLDLLFGGEE